MTECLRFPHCSNRNRIGYSRNTHPLPTLNCQWSTAVMTTWISEVLVSSFVVITGSMTAIWNRGPPIHNPNTLAFDGSNLFPPIACRIQCIVQLTWKYFFWVLVWKGKTISSVPTSTHKIGQFMEGETVKSTPERMHFPDRLSIQVNIKVLRRRTATSE